MAVALSALPSSCPPSLHGPSGLSRASAAMPPPPLFTDEQLEALMSGQCELLDDGDLLSPPFDDEDDASLQAPPVYMDEDDPQAAPPPFSMDDLEAPVPEGDAKLVGPWFTAEEIQVQAMYAARSGEPPPSSDDRAGNKRKSPSPPWPSCIADDDDEDDEPPPPPLPAKRARTKMVGRRRGPSRRRLREWHKAIAARVLRGQFRAPEPSRGRTALGCQCLELAPGGGGPCALHQDAPEADRAWLLSAQGHLPLAGGPGEVLVPTLAAGDGKATVLQYARWRRGVRMPSRFYVQHAVEQGRLAMMPMMADQQQEEEDDWMMLPEYYWGHDQQPPN